MSSPIDPIVMLAFAMQSPKGSYALLLGSGVSRGAGIPTGWEIVLELIRRLAHVHAEKCEPDPETWYRTRFGVAPEYSDLLNRLAQTQTERAQILRGFFEPTEEDCKEGLKVPGEAHRQIASLVASGFVRVIMTTNFDRLIEEAIESKGIVPTVISTPDAVEGALPLIHTPCCVVKLHGDYLDGRIKNTDQELAEYDPRVCQLLERVLDEFGLVVCGWSAEWDTALRGAIERCKNQRFSTYWTLKKDPSPIAERLMNLRRAQPIRITDANGFFMEISEKLLALEEASRPHPLSTQSAVAALKRYIVDDRDRIRLHDLVMKETENLQSALRDSNFPSQGRSISVEDILHRVTKYEEISHTLIQLLGHGCFWGGKENSNLWVKVLGRIANHGQSQSGLEVWLKLRRYPALLLFYAAGIASVASGKYATLLNLLVETKVPNSHDEDKSAASVLYTWNVMEKDISQKLPEMDRRYTPLSDRMLEVLRDTFRELLPDEKEYEKAFDRFELLLALTYADLNREENWVPLGRFGWSRSLLVEIERESKLGSDWPPIKAGLFNGDWNRFDEAFKRLVAFVSRVPWY